MTQGEDQITFEVETGRILEILSREIYDSPNALLRENVQNAYDAILMRIVEQSLYIGNLSIQVEIDGDTITIVDDGIGMTEEVLRNNFWKAGSSGKKTELARRAGVVGTFGIGAMANFGVCKSIRITTRSLTSEYTLVSTANREELHIGRDCIRLERIQDARAPGTSLVAVLDSSVQLTSDQARTYLEPYVRFLPVKVTLNGQLVSQHSYESYFPSQLNTATAISTARISGGSWVANLEVSLSSTSTVVARITGLELAGGAVQGELVLAQNAGPLMGYRNYFGLAPVPTGGHYQLGGVVNLAILQPTAGREALSRESIELVTQLIRLAEASVSDAIAKTDAADRNAGFLQYVLDTARTDLAGRVTIDVQPEDIAVPLADVRTHFEDGKTLHYYGGRDQTIIQMFSSGDSSLLRLAQANPRRGVQHRYVTSILRVPEVPDRATLSKVYDGPDLSIAEASLLLRVITVLAEDYMLPATEVRFADITHNVAVLVEGNRQHLLIYLARGSGLVKPVLACHRTAYEVFGGFVKDFVRVHLYERISQFVPSSTREGADALLKVLQRNRELYRYEDTELGSLDHILADYVAGNVEFAAVLQAAAHVRPQAQSVTSAQVGRIEEQLPDIVDSPTPTPEEVQQRPAAAPPILREDVASQMKVLVATRPYPQLNGFEFFLGLSDRVFNRASAFFRAPHTTKIIWGSRRVIFMFAHASGEVTLYYDVELKEPLEEHNTGGDAFPTTTIITQNRIFVPVPRDLVGAFRVTEGAKEFFVRFDVL